MLLNAGDRLPHFTVEQSRLVKGSVDYFALNHYTSRSTLEHSFDGPLSFSHVPFSTFFYIRFGQAPTVAECALRSGNASRGWDDDQCCVASPVSRNGTVIGPVAGSDWLYVVPWGLRRLLGWISTRYEGVPILITENGCDDPLQVEPMEQLMVEAHADIRLNDTLRIEYLSSYLGAMQKAMHEDGVDVRGYFVWSLLDNFEWADGTSKRFGLYYVEDAGIFPTLQRMEKASVGW